MRTIIITGQYKKDLKLARKRHLPEDKLNEIILKLANQLNQSVKRNKERFPIDFMFQLTQDEFTDLRSQIVTTKLLSKTRSLPYAFTE